MKWLFALSASICLLLGTHAMAQSTAVNLRAVTLEDGAGNRTVLADLIDGPTIVHFWATWCGPCREELPELDAFARAEGLGARLALVSVDTVEFARVSDFLDELGVALESHRQVEGNVGTAFAILGYPSTVVVDDAGTVLFRRQGAVDWEDEDEAGTVIGVLGR